MVEDGGFRYKVSIHKGFGIFHGGDADCAINIGDNTEREIDKKKTKKLRFLLEIDR